MYVMNRPKLVAIAFIPVLLFFMAEAVGAELKYSKQFFCESPEFDNNEVDTQAIETALLATQMLCPLPQQQINLSSNDESSLLFIGINNEFGVSILPPLVPIIDIDTTTEVISNPDQGEVIIDNEANVENENTDTEVSSDTSVEVSPTHETVTNDTDVENDTTGNVHVGASTTDHPKNTEVTVTQHAPIFGDTFKVHFKKNHHRLSLFFNYKLRHILKINTEIEKNSEHDNNKGIVITSQQSESLNNKQDEKITAKPVAGGVEISTESKTEKKVIKTDKNAVVDLNAKIIPKGASPVNASVKADTNGNGAINANVNAGKNTSTNATVNTGGAVPATGVNANVGGVKANVNVH